MRDFFISSFEKLVSLIVVLMVIGTVILAIAAMASPEGGFIPALLVLVVGSLYTIMMGGMLYLALGVYNNTKRTAEAVEILAKK